MAPDPELLILASLADGPKHGYAMMTDIQALSGVQIGPGTLYTAIPRLTEQGLIEALPTTDRRRPYRLTAQGATVLRDQLDALRRFSEASLLRLNP